MNTLRRFAFLFLAVFAVILLVGPVLALAADSSACYSIQDPDARTYCLAKAHGDPSRCYAVQNPALRSQCFAEVRR